MLLREIFCRLKIKPEGKYETEKIELAGVKQSAETLDECTEYDQSSGPHASCWFNPAAPRLSTASVLARAASDVR